jgi:putative ABC transport system ATP-binding protein
MDPLISAVSLTKSYQRGAHCITALNSVSFSVRAGEFVAVIGPSGSGKSTLLNLLGSMDEPTSGTVQVAGLNLHSASEKEKVAFRREQVGFVFQHFGLLPTLTVEENILLPTCFSKSSRHQDLGALLDRLRLTARRNHRPHQLSGGEMQRVAIGRALYHKPKLLLADEPTGSLDSSTAYSILKLLQELNSEGLTILVVTHNPLIAQSAARQIQLADGKIILDTATH